MPALRDPAADLLDGEGFSRRELAEVLRRSASPRLTDMEALLIPWARDTVWMPEQPARIQARTRPLLDALGPRCWSRRWGPPRSRTAASADDAPGMTAALAIALGRRDRARSRRRRLRPAAPGEVGRHSSALARSVERLEHLEQSFQRFAPLDIVEQFAQGASASAPTHRRVTIMFADLKGFTPMSERIQPAAMVEMLNGYFRAMNGALFAHHGHLSRLMGDGLMALFGAIEHNPWQTADAVKAALAMREALAAYNRELAKRGLAKLEFGVGIHTGDVVAGVMGSDRFMEFTVIGDPVNIAARVEALTRVHQVDILVTEEVQKTLDARFVDARDAARRRQGQERADRDLRHRVVRPDAAPSGRGASAERQTGDARRRRWPDRRSSPALRSRRRHHRASLRPRGPRWRRPSTPARHRSGAVGPRSRRTGDSIGVVSLGQRELGVVAERDRHAARDHALRRAARPARRTPRARRPGRRS